MSLRNKFALITGCSSGIGLATTKFLISKKCRVIGISRKKSLIKNGKNFKHIQLDLTELDNFNKITNYLKSEKIKIDFLLNNAGINIPNKFDKINKDDFELVLKTNTYAPFFLTQKLVNFIKRRGSIVNISSFSSISGGPFSSHYTISKSAIEGLTRNLAIFFGNKKIRVNAISPGLIKTRLAKYPKKHPYFDRIILGRAGNPEEIAKVIGYLFSDDSNYINGQTINVDGGMFLK